LHYLPLLEKRPGAWEQAAPIRQWQERWPAVYDRYLQQLRDHLPTAQATREFVRILRLHETYPEKTIAQVLETALHHHCYNADGVKQLLLRITEPERATVPLERETPSALSPATVDWPATTQFDRLLLGLEGGETCV